MSGRRRAVAASLAGAAALALWLPGTATAAGTGGIEVSPVPGVIDGHQVTAFHERTPQRGATRPVAFALRNVTAHPRAAQLYAARAERQPDGTWVVGPAGSSPLVALPPEQVVLPPGAVQQRFFTVRGSKREREQQYAAIVVEVRDGSIVQRAATLVYLDPPQRRPMPLAAALGAAAAVTLAAGGVLAAVRRSRVSGRSGPS